jgi:hypothetical protein
VTSSGAQSYHAVGRAIDVTPDVGIFNWIRQNYGALTRELIFSPMQGAQIHNGRGHWYSDPDVVRTHWNHVHWALDQGGRLAPGWNMAFNGTRDYEVVAARDMIAEEVRKGGGNGDVAIYSVGYVDSAEALRREMIRAMEQRRLETRFA